MEEKLNKNGEDGNFMLKVATFIVDRRNLFFLLFGIACVVCIPARYDGDQSGT